MELILWLLPIAVLAAMCSPGEELSGHDDACVDAYYDSYDELTAAGISENEYCG
jgi:hypothetical protein